MLQERFHGSTYQEGALKLASRYKNRINALLSFIMEIGDGKASDSCEIPYRVDEKYWVTANKTEVTVSFAL
jgi:hypothetical protein